MVHTVRNVDGSICCQSDDPTDMCPKCQRKVANNVKPSPLTIPTINFDELANSQLSRNAQRIANGNGSTDGYNDRFNSPSQVGSVPATGFPSLKPSASDGRGLAGESEDDVDWDAENQRRMQMGNLDRYDTSYDRRPRVSPLVNPPIDWERLVREQRVNDRSLT